MKPNYGAIGAVVVCLVFWGLIAVGSFSLGRVAAEEDFAEAYQELRSELDSATAVLDRLEGLNNECEITGIFDTPREGYQLVTITCPRKWLGEAFKGGVLRK